MIAIVPRRSMVSQKFGTNGVSAFAAAALSASAGTLKEKVSPAVPASGAAAR